MTQDEHLTEGFGRTLDRVLHGEGEIYDFLEKEWRYHPTNQEAAVIARIQQEISEHVGPLLGEADEILEEFYETVRKYDVDDGGEKVYRTYSTGRYIEDWSLLRKEVAEGAIHSLQRVIYRLSVDATEAEMRMKMAYSVWDDDFNQRYREAGHSTIPGNTAIAREDSKDSRYYYLFAYWYWRTIADRVKILTDTRRMLEFHVQRDVKVGSSLPAKGFRYD